MNDILLDQNNDVKFENGDLVIGDATNQNQLQIIAANKGQYKENPGIGVGIDALLNSEDLNEVLIEVKKNLEYDGMRVDNVRFEPKGKLIVDAKYKTNG